MLDLYCKDSIVNKKIHLDTTKPATTHGNIYNNQGEGIAFYIQLPSGANGMELSPQRYLITEMRRQPNGEYTLDYRNSPFVGTFQELNEESGFYTTPNSNGKLYFRGRLPSGLWVNSSRFMVTVLQDGDIRPGDDFLLQFALKEKGSVTGIASEEDFCAVYDHKMLWRANLYIDEGVDDWNDLHPWDSEENEWNRVYEFQPGGVNLTQLAIPDGINGIIPGGQTIIPHAFTWSWMRGNDLDILDRVAYNWQGQDGPFVYNFEMDSQRELLQNHFLINGELIPDELNGNEVFWSETIAPGGDHSNYLHASLGSVYNQQTLARRVNNSYVNDMDTDVAVIEGESETIEIEDQSYQINPYLPSLSNSIAGLIADNGVVDFNKYPELITAGYGAGTDCVSFVKRSSDYDNQYLWRGISNRLWGDQRNIEGYPHVGNHACLVTHFNEGVEDPILGDDVFSKLKLVRPGDIIVYSGAPGFDATTDGSHIMIVQSIEPNENGMISRSGIHIIESTFGAARGSVRNTATLETFRNKQWYIIRLLPGE